MEWMNAGGFGWKHPGCEPRGPCMLHRYQRIPRITGLLLSAIISWSAYEFIPESVIHRFLSAASIRYVVHAFHSVRFLTNYWFHISSLRYFEILKIFLISFQISFKEMKEERYSAYYNYKRPASGRASRVEIDSQSADLHMNSLDFLSAWLRTKWLPDSKRKKLQHKSPVPNSAFKSRMKYFPFLTLFSAVHQFKMISLINCQDNDETFLA